MNRIDVQSKVSQILGSIARVDPMVITSEAHVHDDLGIDSMDLLIVRESLERVFSIFIADEDVGFLDTVARIVDLVVQKQARAAPVSSIEPEANTPHNRGSGSYMGEDDVLFSNLEIGMQVTGRNNLAETPLLREIGHLRWSHMSAIAQVPSRDVVDEEGERLYPTFFYAEVAFPSSRPMATYGENDCFTIVSTLRRFGLSMLDGEHYLFPAHWPENRKLPPAFPEQALQKGVPYLRLSNSFVKQWRGAEWLKRSRPANPGFNRIREMAEAPESYVAAMSAKEEGAFFEIPNSYELLTPNELEIEYQIVPDRDLNGAGLLYFANYPLFLDISERKLLSNVGELALDESLLDRRTLIHRKSAYLSNATANDVLKIKLRSWIENPFLIGSVDPEMAPIRLLLNYEMRRESDDRLMMVSSAKKIVMGQTLGDTGLLGHLRAQVK